jgi:hypothetical protein
MSLGDAIFEFESKSRSVARAGVRQARADGSTKSLTMTKLIHKRRLIKLEGVA